MELVLCVGAQCFRFITQKTEMTKKKQHHSSRVHSSQELKRRCVQE